jgi:type IX secretion system PorP/SprF family membrane protein
MVRTLALVALLGSATVLRAQDPEFTQFFANPLYLNPAFAGTAEGARFALNFRDQWPSMQGSFITYSASYDQHLDALGGGIGAQAWYDRAGDGRLATKYVSGMYSYQLKVKDATRDFFIIKAGLQVSAFQRSVDFSKFEFGDEIHPRYGFGTYPTREKLPTTGFYQTGVKPDFSGGLLAYTKKFYGGFAVHHIIQPSISFFDSPDSKLQRKYSAHMGMMIPVDHWKRKPETFISPNVLVQRQGNFTQFNLGAYGMKGPFMLGASFRQTDPNSDALMLFAGVHKNIVKIGYSYDMTISDARSAVPGSHEVSLIIELKKYSPRTIKNFKPLPCPWSHN